MKYNLLGQKFNRLEVIKELPKRIDTSVVWLCKCECGNLKEVSSKMLINKVTKSCGCLFKEINILRSDRRKKRPYEYLYNRLVKDATRRKVPLVITYEQFITFTNIPKCYYCHHEVFWNAHIASSIKKRYIQCNLDRIDNDKGYELENLKVCCKRCNIGKNQHFTHDEWYKMTEPFRTGELK